MDYIFAQKLNMKNVRSDFEYPPKLVAIFEPEEYLRALYEKKFRAHNFLVQQISGTKQLLGLLDLLTPDLLIINSQFSADHRLVISFLKQLHVKFPSLPKVSLGKDLPAEHLKQLMSYGVVSHVERRLSRPNDLVAIAKTILYP